MSEKSKPTTEHVSPRPESYWPQPWVMVFGCAWAVCLLVIWGIDNPTPERLLGMAMAWSPGFLLAYLYFLHSQRKPRGR